MARKSDARTDVHRVGAFVPGDYDYVFSFSGASSQGGWPIPSVNMDLVRELRAAGGFALKAQGLEVSRATNQCDVCGAYFVHGDVWRHRPSGLHVTLGHECAAKYEMLADRSEWAELKGAALAKVARRLRLVSRVAEARRFLAGAPAVRRALRLRHRITRDLARSLVSFGSLTPKQVALALKLEREAATRSAVGELVKVPVPAAALDGRVVLEGRVLSVKLHEGAFGDSLKMTVAVDAPGGVFLAWGTCPRSLPGELVGARVRFSAALKPGREAHFALFSRPTGAEVVAPAAGEAAA